jgi:electron transport complex protein RnfC
MSRQLGRFPGGLVLPDHKQWAAQRPIAALPVPGRIILPLQQHIGEPAQPTIGLGDTVLRGQMIARPHGYVSAAVHASTSGTVTDIGEYPVPHPSGLSAPCIVIDSDGHDQTIETEARPPLEDLSADELRQMVREAGIVGLGGAVFPTSVKLNPGRDRPVHTLILNAAECEPYIACDDALLRERPEEVLGGARVLMRILAADHCIIGIEDNKPQAYRSLDEALAAAPVEGMRVEQVPTLYPSGGENQLIETLTGKVVPSGALPADVGLLCQNVGTAAAVYHALTRAEPLISRIVSVTGPAIGRPQNLEVRIGTPIRELVAYCGGYTAPVQRLIMGGPMMGIALHTDAAPVVKASNCILALAARADAQGRQPAMPCIRCGACAEVCPVRLLPQQLYWYARARDMDKVQDYQLFDCIECGCCTYVCPSHLPLVDYFRFAKTNIWALDRDRQRADLARRRHEQREARLLRIQSEQEANRRRRKEALQRRTPAEDPKKAAIEAAVARVRARKAAQQTVEKPSEERSPHHSSHP